MIKVGDRYLLLYSRPLVISTLSASSPVMIAFVEMKESKIHYRCDKMPKILGVTHEKSVLLFAHLTNCSDVLQLNMAEEKMFC